MNKTNQISPILEDKLNEIYHLTNDIEEKTQRKNKVRNELITLIKADKLEGRKFSIGNRYIKYKMENHTECLSQKFLLRALQDYYGPKDLDESLKIYKFILNKREQKTWEGIIIDKKK